MAENLGFGDGWLLQKNLGFGVGFGYRNNTSIHPFVPKLSCTENDLTQTGYTGVCLQLKGSVRCEKAFFSVRNLEDLWNSLPEKLQCNLVISPLDISPNSLLANSCRGTDFPVFHLPC